MSRREDEDALEEEDDHDQAPAVQPARRAKAAAPAGAAEPPAKRSRKVLSDDQSEEEAEEEQEEGEASDQEDRSGGRGKGKQQRQRQQQQGRARMGNLVQRPVTQGLQDHESEGEGAAVAGGGRRRRARVDSDSEGDEESEPEEEDEGPARQRNQKAAATGNGSNRRAALAAKAATACGSSKAAQKPGAGPMGPPPPRPPVKQQKPATPPAQVAASSQQQRQQQQQQQQPRTPAAAAAGPSSQRQSQQAAAAAGGSSSQRQQGQQQQQQAGPSSQQRQQQQQSGTQGNRSTPGRSDVAHLIADKAQLKDLKTLLSTAVSLRAFLMAFEHMLSSSFRCTLRPLAAWPKSRLPHAPHPTRAAAQSVDKYGGREQESREEKAALVQSVETEDLEEMAGRAVRLLLFKSHEKPKEVVPRKKVNDAMSEGCRDNPKLIKLMPVALAMAQARLLSVFAIECKDVKDPQAGGESRFLLVNALPSVYRTRLVNKAADDAPRVFALLVLSLITLGGGEMSAGELWSNLGQLCLEQRVGHPAFARTPWEELNRLEIIKYVAVTKEGEDHEHIYRIGECGKAEVSSAELQAFIGQTFKAYREKLALGPVEDEDGEDTGSGDSDDVVVVG
ncbi:MAG: hypothetical protein WDW36_007282 [Sanguina aurantia]